MRCSILFFTNTLTASVFPLMVLCYDFTDYTHCTTIMLNVMVLVFNHDEHTEDNHFTAARPAVLHMTISLFPFKPQKVCYKNIHSCMLLYILLFQEPKISLIQPRVKKIFLE